MPGLEPGIQALPFVIVTRTSALDARVKPAHDEEGRRTEPNSTGRGAAPRKGTVERDERGRGEPDVVSETPFSVSFHLCRRHSLGVADRRRVRRGRAAAVGTLIKGRYGAAQWFEFLLFGLTIGSVYALVALGYTMVYGVLRLINFAHGDIMMTGAFSGYFVASRFAETGFLDRHPALAMLGILAVAVATSTIIALLTERLAYRPFRHVRGLAPLICAIGVSFFLEQTFRGAFGSGIRAYPDPKWQSRTISITASAFRPVQIMVLPPRSSRCRSSTSSCSAPGWEPRCARSRRTPIPPP